MGMDDSGPVEIVPGTPERRIIDYKYANGVLVQSFQGQLNPKFQDIPAGFDPATRFMWQILFVGDRGWIVAGREGPLKASDPAILADVIADAGRAAAGPRREDRCHFAAGPGRADLSGARLRAPRQLDSSDSAPLAAGVECGGRDAIDKRRRTWRTSPPGRAARRSGIRSRKNSSATTRPIACARGRCGRPGRCSATGSWFRRPFQR